VGALVLLADGGQVPPGSALLEAIIDFAGAVDANVRGCASRTRRRDSTCSPASGIAAPSMSSWSR